MDGRTDDGKLNSPPSSLREAWDGNIKKNRPSQEQFLSGKQIINNLYVLLAYRSAIERAQ